MLPFFMQKLFFPSREDFERRIFPEFFIRCPLDPSYNYIAVARYRNMRLADCELRGIEFARAVHFELQSINLASALNVTRTGDADVHLVTLYLACTNTSAAGNIYQRSAKQICLNVTRTAD